MGKGMTLIRAAVKIGSASSPREKRAGRAGRRCEHTMLQELPSVHWHLGTPLSCCLKAGRTVLNPGEPSPRSTKGVRNTLLLCAGNFQCFRQQYLSQLIIPSGQGFEEFRK